MQTTKMVGIVRQMALVTGLFWLGMVRMAPVEASEESYPLVTDSKSRCIVIVNTNATPPERHAADELKTYLQKISGAQIPELAAIDQKSSSFPIYLGTAETLPVIDRPGLKARISALSNEGFVIQSDGKGLVIAGKKPIGVLYGVYTLLEEQFGVRWFFPGENGEYCPKTADIAIGVIDTVQNPVFVVRCINYTCTGPDTRLTATWDWTVRNKMQIITYGKAAWAKSPEAEKELRERGAMIGNGNLSDAEYDNKALFASHPEYYALINGKRVDHTYNWVGSEATRYQLCTSNPDIADLWAKVIVKRFHDEKFPTDYYRMANVDSGKWCECDKCRALDDPEEAKKGCVSTRFYRCINEVAGRVWKECPDALIEAWGYQNFHSAPRGVKPDPRVAIKLVGHSRCYQHSYDDPNCPANVNFMKLFDEWKAVANIVGTFEFYECFVANQGAYQYLPLEESAARNVQYLAGKGAKYWGCEIPPPEGVFSGVWDTSLTRETWVSHFECYYMAAKMLWNPGRNIAATIDDMYRKYYGPAYEPMKAYRQLLRKSWEQGEGHFIYGTPYSHIGKSLVKPGVEKDLLGYLAAGEKAAANDPAAMERVQRDKKYFAEVWQKAAVEWNKLSAVKEVRATKRARESSEMTIDGVLDEAEWDTVVPVTGFVGEAGKAPARAQTFVKCLYDDDYIYIGAAAMEPMIDKLAMNKTERDSSVWEDDAIEIFIDPEGTGANYYHLAVNPKGAIYDAKCAPGAFDVEYNADCQAACKIMSDRWVLEMKIKASSLNAKINDGGIWKMNVARDRRPDGGEGSSWAMDGSFHQPLSFRTVTFGLEGPLVQNGGFEDVQEMKALPKGWASGNAPAIMPAIWCLQEKKGTATIVANDVHSGKKAWKIEKGGIANYFAAATGDKLHIEFWAKGEGKLELGLFQYSMTPEGKPQFIGTDSLDSLALSAEWKRYEYERPVIKDKVGMVGLAFTTDGALIIDDVTVRKTH